MWAVYIVSKNKRFQFGNNEKKNVHRIENQDLQQLFQKLITKGAIVRENLAFLPTTQKVETREPRNHRNSFWFKILILNSYECIDFK